MNGGGAGEEDPTQNESITAIQSTAGKSSASPSQQKLEAVSCDATTQPVEATQSVSESDKSFGEGPADKSFSDDSRSEHEPAPLCKNGVMDLSRRGLHQLHRKFRKEYGIVKKLIISGNKFTNVTGFDMFKICSQVDASNNSLNKLSSFLPLAKNLKSLHLSTNAITNIDCLRSFVNLETLDVSCNLIQNIPVALDNPRLAYLNLSSNAVASIPDLSKLNSLSHLNVSSNIISSFKGAVFPKRLTSFDISSNKIDDLTEFLRLLPLERLESLSLAGNPCVIEQLFDYRIYILSVLPSLQEIDDFIVQEEEQLKGEWLYSQGKGRSFKPDTGAHVALVQYLQRFCPFNVEGKLTSTLDQSLVKVMEKRREILNHSGLDEDSSQSLTVHSPYGAWAAQLEGKENQIPSSSADESGSPRRSSSARLSHSNAPAREPSMSSRRVSQFEPLSRTSTMDSVGSSSTVTLIPAEKNKKENMGETPSTAAAARVDHNGRQYLRERLLQMEEEDNSGSRQPGKLQEARLFNAKFSKDTLLPIRATKTVSVHASSSRPSDNRKQSRPSPIPTVADISMDAGAAKRRDKDTHLEEMVVRRVMELEERVSTLAEENENLTRINDELSRLLVEITDRFKSDIEMLKVQLSAVKPHHNPEPCNLRVARELGNGAFEIIWDLPIVKCYKVFTNGVESGVVRAPNNAARISDVDPGVELSVQLQAVHFDGSVSAPSQPLILQPSER